MCEVFQLGLNFHSAGELGIGTHITELGGEVIKDVVIALTGRGTIRVPEVPGLGVELDPDRFSAAKETYLKLGDRSVYEEDEARDGVIPVKLML